MGKNSTGYFIISTFVTLYLLVSIISTIHVIDFFMLSNPRWLAISLAIAFEVGAAASLASLITLKKMNKLMVWSLFIILTLMQAMGNTYYAFTHLLNFQGWIELFGLVDEELIYQKRVLSIVSGAILPVVALGFIKSLVDYIKPEDETTHITTQVKDFNGSNAQPSLAEPGADLESAGSHKDDFVAPDQTEPMKPANIKDYLEITTTTTQKSQINKHRSIDELIARGMPLDVSSSLKKPFDP